MIEDIARSWNWVDAPSLSSAQEQVLGEVFWRLLSGKPAVPADVARALWRQFARRNAAARAESQGG